MLKTLNIVRNTGVIKHYNQMGEVWIFLIQLHQKNKRISKLLSMNCAGLNPVKLYKYKQYPYIIKMKEKNWMKLKNWGRKWIITTILVWKILLRSYLSLFHLNSNFMKMRKQNEDIILNIINWFHSDLFYTDVHTEIV